MQAGLLSRETCSSGVPTPSPQVGGNICGSAMRELPWDPARSENLGMYGSSLRENREISSLPVAVIGWRARMGKPWVALAGRSWLSEGQGAVHTLLRLTGGDRWARSQHFREA